MSDKENFKTLFINIELASAKPNNELLGKRTKKIDILKFSKITSIVIITDQ